MNSKRDINHNYNFDSINDAQYIGNLLKKMGIDHTKDSIKCILEFYNDYVNSILAGSKAIARHANRKFVSVDEVEVAIALKENSMRNIPAKDLIDLAESINSDPLPQIKRFNSMYPPDSSILRSNNYKFRDDKAPMKPAASKRRRTSKKKLSSACLMKTQTVSFSPLKALKSSKKKMKNVKSAVKTNTFVDIDVTAAYGSNSSMMPVPPLLFTNAKKIKKSGASSKAQTTSKQSIRNISEKLLAENRYTQLSALQDYNSVPDSWVNQNVMYLAVDNSQLTSQNLGNQSVEYISQQLFADNCYMQLPAVQNRYSVPDSCVNQTVINLSVDEAELATQTSYNQSIGYF